MWSWMFLVCWFVATISLCVCAPQSGIIFPSDTDDDSSQHTGGSKPSVSDGKSAQMCKKYAESVYSKLKNLSGQVVFIGDSCSRIEPLQARMKRIVQGTPTVPMEYPHMALIGYPANDKSRKKWSCGGSLISERFVLSAAHCNTIGKVRPKWVRVGDYNFKSTTDDDEIDALPVDYDIVEIIPHPEYDRVKTYNDISLYKLDRDVVFNEYMRPICLHTEHQLPQSYFIITGWGHVDFGEPSKGHLLKGNISYVPRDECESLLRPALKGRQMEIRDKTMICAANFVNGTDTCQVDAGGPMQYPLAAPYCMYSLVGITSFGARCGWIEGEPKYPAIYTRVSYFVPWIERIVWP